jgi:hypothetical protein
LFGVSSNLLCLPELFYHLGLAIKKFLKKGMHEFLMARRATREQ